MLACFKVIINIPTWHFLLFSAPAIPIDPVIENCQKIKRKQNNAFI